MKFIEDHAGGDVTDFAICDSRAVLAVTHDYKTFFRVEIWNRDGSPIKWKSNWIDFRFRTALESDHSSFGELEIVQVENGHVYLDCDFGSFDFTADQTMPPSKNA
jgi:hypothetical protein